MNVGAKYFAVGSVLTLPFRFSTALSGFASSFALSCSSYICVSRRSRTRQNRRLSGEKQGSYRETLKRGRHSEEVKVLINRMRLLNLGEKREEEVIRADSVLQLMRQRWTLIPPLSEESNHMTCGDYFFLNIFSMTGHKKEEKRK